MTTFTHTSNDLVLCTDSRIRPRWASRGQLGWDYFDKEWGRPLVSETEICELLSMVVFHLGLTWRAVLAKRGTLRLAFAGFDVASVAEFGEDDINRLLADPGIFRNRRKIEAVINNASALTRLTEPLPQVLGRYSHGFVRHVDQPLPHFTDGSKEAAVFLRKAGISHIGPSTTFILMHATGVVDGHWRGAGRQRSR